MKIRNSMGSKLWKSVLCVVLIVSAGWCRDQLVALNQIETRVIAKEADAVLTILAKRSVNEPVLHSDWKRLFSSEGNSGVQQHEEALNQPFEDAPFGEFVLAQKLLSKLTVLKSMLESWKSAGISCAAKLALDYMPQGAKVKNGLPCHRASEQMNDLHW